MDSSIQDLGRIARILCEWPPSYGLLCEYHLELRNYPYKRLAREQSLCLQSRTLVTALGRGANNYHIAWDGGRNYSPG